MAFVVIFSLGFSLLEAFFILRAAGVVKALILAAGRGERMRPLTDELPKPLLTAGGKTLIEHRLDGLRQAGVSECVINLAYHGDQIRARLGNGARYGMQITYSDEGNEALESAGGIIHALPLLGEGFFLLVNADIWTDFNLRDFPVQPRGLAHLLMVDNPAHHAEGDFALCDGWLDAGAQPRLTYSGIGLFDTALFQGYAPGKRPLRPVLLDAMRQKAVSGQYYGGDWLDIGTPDRLQELRRRLGGA